MTEEKFGKVFLNWKFPDRKNYERGRWWYIVMALITVPVIIYSVIRADFLFILIVVLFLLIILFLNRRPSMDVEVSITEIGILIGSKFFPYSDIKKFYIVYDPPEVKKMYLEFKALRPYIGISIEDINPLNLRQILLEYLLEDTTKDGEPPTELLERILKL